MRIAVPYRPHHDPKGFAVHRPKFIVATLARQDGARLQDAFFRGVFSHDYGAPRLAGVLGPERVSRTACLRA